MLAFGLLFCVLLNLTLQETFDSSCASYVVSVKERGRRWISGTYNFLESNGTRPSFKHESKDLYLWYRSEGSDGSRWLISNGKRRNSSKYPGLIWAETTDMPSTELEWRRIVKTMDTDGNVFMTAISDINVSIGCVGCVESSQICFDNTGIILNPGITLPCCSGLTCVLSSENSNIIGKCTDPSVVVSTTSPTCLREEQTCFDPATIEDLDEDLVLNSCCSGMICTPTPEMTFTFSDGYALSYGVCRAPTNGVDKENGECFDLYRNNEAYICPNGQTCVFDRFSGVFMVCWWWMAVGFCTYA